MAVNFGDTQMEGRIEPSVRQQAPVDDQSGAILARGLGNTLETIGGALGSVFGAASKVNGNKILVDYENELLDLADAVDQGSLSKNEAMIRARAMRRQYLANAPGLQDDFDGVWANTMGANGLGHIVIEGTPEDKAYESMRQEAAKLGYTPEEFGLFTSRARQATELNYQLDSAEKSGRIITETQRLQGLQAIVGLADAAYPAAQKKINDAMTKIQATSDPAAKAAIVGEVVQSLGNSIAQVKHLGGNADTSYIVAPIEGAIETFQKWASGSVEASVLESELKVAELKLDLMYTNDTILGPVIVASKMIGELGMQNSSIAESIWTPGVIKRLADIAKPNGVVDLIKNDDDNARTAEVIKESAGLAVQSTDEDFVKEVGSAINQAIDSAYVYERSAESALDFKDVVELIGSNEVGALISSGKVGIEAKNAPQFVNILKNNYETELLPAINKAWLSEVDVTDYDTLSYEQVGSSEARATVTPLRGPTRDFVEPRWNGNSLEFVPRAGFESNAQVIKLASELTSGGKSIAGPLNTLIKAYSNATGVDAGKIYEEDFAQRLFNVEANEDFSDSSLSLDNFAEDEIDQANNFSPQSSSLATQLPPLEASYVEASGINFDSYLPSIRKAESSGNDSLKNPASSATGRYQFLRDTWNGLIRRYPNAGLTPDGRLNPQQQEVAIRLFTAENARSLKNAGIPLNNGTLYAAHFLGAGDAVKVLRATSGNVSDYVPSRVISANPFLRGMSVVQFRAWANRKGNL